MPNSLTRFPVVPPIEPVPQVPMDVPVTAWKAYGYWARPVIEGIEVRNDASECIVFVHPNALLRNPQHRLQITYCKV